MKVISLLRGSLLSTLFDHWDKSADSCLTPWWSHNIEADEPYPVPIGFRFLVLSYLSRPLLGVSQMFEVGRPQFSIRNVRHYSCDHNQIRLTILFPLKLVVQSLHSIYSLFHFWQNSRDWLLPSVVKNTNQRQLSENFTVVLLERLVEFIYQPS